MVAQGCGQAPSPELRSAIALSEGLKVDGYRQIWRETDEGFHVRTWYIGAANADLFAIVSAPRWSPATPPSWFPKDNLYEVMISSTTPSDENGIGCRIDVKRLKQGLDPPSRFDMTDADIGAIREGLIAYVEVDIHCAEYP